MSIEWGQHKSRDTCQFGWLQSSGTLLKAKGIWLRKQDSFSDLNAESRRKKEILLMLLFLALLMSIGETRRHC